MKSTKICVYAHKQYFGLHKIWLNHKLADWLILRLGEPACVNLYRHSRTHNRYWADRRRQCCWEVGGTPQWLSVIKVERSFQKGLLWLHSVFPWGEHSSQIGQKNFNGAANGLRLDRRRSRGVGGPCRWRTEWGSKCYVGGWGLKFHPSRERGRWGSRLPHLPVTFKGELERSIEKGFSAAMRLWGGHRGLYSRGISVRMVVGWMEPQLLLAMSGFSVFQVA